MDNVVVFSQYSNSSSIEAWADPAPTEWVAMRAEHYITIPGQCATTKTLQNDANQ